MSSKHPRAKGWYVADRFSYTILRGPYLCSEAAGAVREEMELGRGYDHMNLWIIDEKTADWFGDEWHKANPKARKAKR